MEEIKLDNIANVSAETTEILKKNNLYLHDVDLAYKTDGAEVFISQERKKNKYGYAISAKICVVKDKKSLIFDMGEEIGNEQGTIFTRASVQGLPCRNEANEKADYGMYPYSITPKDCQLEGNDLFIRAAQIYRRYDTETEGKIAIGEAFANYVPKSFDALKDYFKQKEADAKQKQNSDWVKSAMAKFKDNLKGF